MKKSEMELQAIREKLQSLKADLPLEEDNPLPWPPASLSNHFSYTSQEPPEEDDQNLAQIASTVETLKQRSNLHLQQYANTAAPSPTSPSLPYPPPPSTEAQDRLLELNWKRLAAQAQRINQLSQTQESAILELKAIANRLEQDLRKRETLGEQSAYPGDRIPAVCQYKSAIVPEVTQDRQGRMILTHRSIDLYQAEREASLTANALRDRAVSRNMAVQDLENPPDLGLNCLIEEPIGFIQTFWNGCSAQVQQLSQRSPHPDNHRPTHRRPTNRRLTSHNRSSDMSWLDAMIWFSSSAIIRLGLNFLLAAYPALWPPVLVMILALMAIALYQTAFAKSSNFGLGYRLLLAIAGLIVGGQL